MNEYRVERSLERDGCRTPAREGMSPTPPGRHRSANAIDAEYPEWPSKRTGRRHGKRYRQPDRL